MYGDGSEGGIFVLRPYLDVFGHQQPIFIQEIFFIKRTIRVSFKRDGVAPLATLDFYKIGKVLGRGSLGKVNLGLHKLTRKLIAIKSVNKNLKPMAEKWERFQNEVSIMK